ncbi:uncharacterized protein VTP21DRAFT_7916 [Calcarisporiella thermophila]|uniref:uncharacterized protein n=1 Tax=Calcarisporiella thermophila TaxID=911321 RepID=UPI0037427FD1
MFSRLPLLRARSAPAAARLLFSHPSNARQRLCPPRRLHHGDTRPTQGVFAPLDTFTRRHLGSTKQEEVGTMLQTVGVKNFEELVSKVVPPGIRTPRPLAIDGGFTESELLHRLKAIASKNKVYRSYIGMGYTNTIVPAVILRNILENPGWYTQYTPYQPEISQGRLESLLNFQTMVTDMTGLPIANASLLDEGTAAAEAMLMCWQAGKRKRSVFFVDANCHPQTIACLQTRAEAFGIRVAVGDHQSFDFDAVKSDLAGVLVQYPGSDGAVVDYQALSDKVHALGGEVVVATDLMALTMLKPPGEFGADIAVGNSQRFGVPLGYGGPHAAFFACKEHHKRRMPGRLVGVSKDADGNKALRLALQTREQHIRREKATSNVCTAQALLANMSAMYAVYHGPEGVRSIAQRIHNMATVLADGIQSAGHHVKSEVFFDTLTVEVQGGSAQAVLDKALAKGINLRRVDDKTVGVTLDEAVTREDLQDLFEVFSIGSTPEALAQKLGITHESPAQFSATFARKTPYLQHEVFNKYHSETEMVRYLNHLQQKDLSLLHSMIPLGSCTMKLNATTEMIPVTWPEFAQIHPFAPRDQAEGYTIMHKELEADIAELTGFDSVSLQPNSGAQGEYAGLRVIRAYHESRGEAHRKVCLIPVSAHGTNPASAAMAGMDVVPIKCDIEGNLDLDDMRAKAAKYKDTLAAVMITYPSTFGVFEPGVAEACKIIHEHGGQVYMDGANLNAQLGLTKPAEIGADVCHLNLHKTFCIPHGGGGPGMGPIGVKQHLAEFLPGHPVVNIGSAKAIGPVSAAPWGSASILPISWAYIKMMGGEGLKLATQTALLNANYMKARLAPHYKIYYTNSAGYCAHEFIVDLAPFEKTTGLGAIDVAKRLQDYGFHSPTMSWPVANTLMIEPTESESLSELDRFCDAMIAIREEIREVEEGKQPRGNNVLAQAPHTLATLMADKWERPYPREKAAYPLAYLKTRKFWPTVSRVDDAYGDRHLVCTCPSVEEMAAAV